MLTQLDSESAARNLTTLVTCLTYAAATGVNHRAQGRIELGDGVKDLDGTGGLFKLRITVDSQVVSGGDILYQLGTQVRAVITTPELILKGGETVTIAVESPNANDSDVAVTAQLFDLQDANVEHWKGQAAAELGQYLARARGYNAVYFVDAGSGNDSNDGLSWQKALATLGAAKTAAAAGDLIVVGAGTYDEKNLAKDGVDWHFVRGSMVISTSASNGGIWDDSATGANGPTSFNVFGEGWFEINSSGTNDDCIRCFNAASVMRIECDRLESTGGRAVICSAGELTLRARYATSADGVIDMANAAGRMFIDVDHIESGGSYCLEIDDGEMHVRARLIDGKTSQEVCELVTGNVTIRGATIIGSHASGVAVNDTGCDRIDLIDCAIEMSGASSADIHSAGNVRVANTIYDPAKVTGTVTGPQGAIADAVLDEAINDHLGAGTLGAYISQISIFGNSAVTNTTTLINRIGAWTGSGANTILGAPQALFRKDNGVSVPSDINTGGGTANNATDSIEALRDQGDAAWSTANLAGPGADPVTITITKSDASPLADADVWITNDSAGNNVVAGTQQTDSAGQVTFMLDAGVTYYLWAQKDGFNSHSGTAFVAAAD